MSDILGTVFAISACLLVARCGAINVTKANQIDDYNEKLVPAAEIAMSKIGLPDVIDVSRTHRYHSMPAPTPTESGKLPLYNYPLYESHQTDTVNVEDYGSGSFETLGYGLNDEGKKITDRELGYKGRYGVWWLLAGKDFSSSLYIPDAQIANSEDVFFKTEANGTRDHTGYKHQSIICVTGLIVSQDRMFTVPESDLMLAGSLDPKNKYGENVRMQIKAQTCAIYEQVGPKGAEKTENGMESESPSNPGGPRTFYQEHTETRRLQRITKPFSGTVAASIEQTAAYKDVESYDPVTFRHKSGYTGVARSFTIPANLRYAPAPKPVS